MEIANDGGSGRAKLCGQGIQSGALGDDFECEGGELGAGHGAPPGLGRGFHDGNPGREFLQFLHDGFRPGLETLKRRRKEIQDRNVGGASTLAVEVIIDAFLENGEDEFVTAYRPEEGFGLDAGHEVGVAGDNAGLGAAE